MPKPEVRMDQNHVLKVMVAGEGGGWEPEEGVGVPKKEVKRS